MEKLTNVIVQDVFKGKSGISKVGAWQAWSIYLEGYETKFSYFEKDGIIPFPGMQITFLEYTVEQRGEYTNYDIKKLVPVQLTAPGVLPEVPQVSPTSNLAVRPSSAKPSMPDRLSSVEKNKRVTMCTSYAKDIMVQMIANGGYPTESLSAVLDLVAKGGKRLAEKIETEAGNKLLKPVTMTKLQPDDTLDGVEVSELPTIPGEAVPITPEMVKAANAALPASTSKQLGLPGAVPEHNDDAPF